MTMFLRFFPVLVALCLSVGLLACLQENNSVPSDSSSPDSISQSPTSPGTAEDFHNQGIEKVS